MAVFALIGSSLCTAEVWAARPAAEELAQREAWVRAHFPLKPTGTSAPAAPAKPRPAGLMAWTSLGPVFCNTLPGRALQIAERKFEHGLFCHAPGRVQVYLPGRARSFSAVVGILTNPDSQGGSVIFSVDAGEKRLFSSGVMHRGNPPRGRLFRLLGRTRPAASEAVD
jgi:hypothetical protein